MLRDEENLVLMRAITFTTVDSRGDKTKQL